MSKRLIDFDPISGISCYFAYEPHTDTGTILHTQDVEPIIERNKIARNDDEKTKRGIKKDNWKYADVPLSLWLQWRTKYGVDVFQRPNHELLFRLLNSPEYAYLKATTKHHEVRN